MIFKKHKIQFNLKECSGLAVEGVEFSVPPHFSTEVFLVKTNWEMKVTGSSSADLCTTK